ncbi:hypothetical protein CEXT_609431 [Caerostris extrusa]|uniref:Uncharacterized protein n=1 Tax=Caerostris extrusa TaxID=172846 RepID=A0AAV4V1Y9_CAEEX|nr:hypothetical protein CEXT_609431 [Caerostris extrusa]
MSVASVQEPEEYAGEKEGSERRGTSGVYGQCRVADFQLESSERKVRRGFSGKGVLRGNFYLPIFLVEELLHVFVNRQEQLHASFENCKACFLL